MNLNLTLATRVGLNICAVFGITAALYMGGSIFIPVVFSILLASVLFPFAKRLHEKLFMPWFFACLSALMVVVVLTLVVIGAFAWAIPKTIVGLPQTEDEWVKQYNKIQLNLSTIFPISDNDEFFGRWNPERDKERQSVDKAKERSAPDNDKAQPPPPQPRAVALIKSQLTDEKTSGGVARLISTGLDHLWQAILIMFITLFLIYEGQMLADKVKRIFGPSLETRGRVTYALAEMAEAIRTYLVWRTIVNLCLALVLGAVYQWAGLKHWYLWALLVAILSYVPYVGTIAAGIPPFLDGLLFVDPFTAFWIGIFYIFVVTFEGYIIVPWVMGRSMDLNATTVLLACLYWHQVWGISGLFLAMPLMAALKAICMQVQGWQGWGHLMGSGPAVELQIDSPEVEKARLEEIERGAATNDQTVRMDAPQKGAAQPGDSKSFQ